jgi:hypothetical protein
MNFQDPQIISDKVLDMEKVLQLNEHGQKTISDMWSSLLWHANFFDPAGIKKTHKDYNPSAFTCYYNTLNDFGFLKDKLK